MNISMAPVPWLFPLVNSSYENNENRCNTLKTLPCNKDYCSGFGVSFHAITTTVVIFAHAVNTTFVTLVHAINTIYSKLKTLPLTRQIDYPRQKHYRHSSINDFKKMFLKKSHLLTNDHSDFGVGS